VSSRPFSSHSVSLIYVIYVGYIDIGEILI
jgi:hypothetical protein